MTWWNICEMRLLKKKDKKQKIIFQRLDVLKVTSSLEPRDFTSRTERAQHLALETP